MFTVRPLTWGTSRGLTPAGRVPLPYGGNFSKGAIVVICAVAADRIAAPPSAEAPATNSRRESDGVVVSLMFTPAPERGLTRRSRPPWRSNVRPVASLQLVLRQRFA